MDGYGASRCGFPYSQTNMQRTREGGISLTVRETANYVCRRGVKKLSPCDFLLKIVALSSKSNFFFYPAGSTGRVLYLTRFFFLSFFLLATLLRLKALTCFDRFQPDLVIRTPDTWHLCHKTTVGSKVT